MLLAACGPSRVPEAEPSHSRQAPPPAARTHCRSAQHSPSQARRAATPPDTTNSRYLGRRPSAPTVAPRLGAPGEFTMGSEGGVTTRPPHDVRITRGWLAKRSDECGFERSAYTGRRFPVSDGATATGRLRELTMPGPTASTGLTLPWRPNGSTQRQAGGFTQGDDGDAVAAATALTEVWWPDVPGRQLAAGASRCGALDMAGTSGRGGLVR